MRPLIVLNLCLCVFLINGYPLNPFEEVITITITNTKANPFYFKWTEILSIGFLRISLKKFGEDNEREPFRAKEDVDALLQEMQTDMKQLILPGESISCPINISRYFNTKDEGVYQVKYRPPEAYFIFSRENLLETKLTIGGDLDKPCQKNIYKNSDYISEDIEQAFFADSEYLFMEKILTKDPLVM